MSFGVDPTGKTQSGVQLPNRSVPGARAEGLASKARAPGSHAEGDASLAFADGAHAEGVGSVAVGAGAHAENNSQSTGDRGHAEGRSCIAGNTPRHFTVSGTTVTIQGTVTDEFNDGGSNPKVVRFYDLAGGSHNKLHVADRNISSPVVNQTGSLVAYVAQGGCVGGGGCPGPYNLYTINLGSGVQTLVGALTCGGAAVSVTGMAMDPTSGIMYAVSGGASPNFAQSLFTLDLSNGHLTLVGTLLNVVEDHPLTTLTGGPTPDISFDMHGNLWGTCINSPHFAVLNSIDKTNGQRIVTQTDRELNGTIGLGFAFMNKTQRAFILSWDNGPTHSGPNTLRLTEVNPIGWATVNQLTVTGPAAGIIIGSCFFDQSNTLYAVSNNGGGPFALYTIDVTTGVSTLVASLARVYDASVLAIAYNTTFTIDSVLDDRTSGTAVHPSDGDSDHAEGIICQASGGNAHAQGNRCTAIGNGSHAEGHMSVANSNAVPTDSFGCHAEGKSVALAPFSHAEGLGAFVFTDSGHAEGSNTRSVGIAAHAEGLETVAQANWAHAEGGTAQAYGDSSHAQGGSTQVNSEGGHVEGENNRAGPIRRAFTVSGTTATIAGGDFTNEFHNTDVIRFVDLLGGTNQTLFYGDRTIASVAFNVGPNTTTFDIGSALDDRTSGFCFNQFFGQDAHAEGNGTIATGFASHSEGNNSVAAGDEAHAEGSGTAAGEFSHAEGDNTIAVGDDSHAGGGSCEANGHYSRAIGNQTQTGHPLRSFTASGTTITIAGGDFTAEFPNGSTVKLFDFNGNFATAVGTSGVAFGGGNTTFTVPNDMGSLNSGQCVATYTGVSTGFPGLGSFATGVKSVARLQGQMALASENFSKKGDSQATKIVLSNKTTNNTGTELFIDGTVATLKLTIPLNTTFTYRIDVVARQTGGTDTCAAFYLTGFITVQGTVGSTRLNAGSTTSILDAGSGTWTVVASANTVDGALKITVTGQNAKNINWVATVWLTETAE